MRAITLIQPWATAITHAGKRVENRTWTPPKYLLDGEKLCIHAGKKIDFAVLTELGIRKVWDDAWTVPLGAIVAVCSVNGVYTESTRSFLPEHQRYWYCGPFAWSLSNLIVLPEPVPCKGAQGLWFLPPDVCQLVLRQMKEARP